MAVKGKKAKKVISEGIAHIHSSFNNIIISLTNLTGQVISWSSAGKMGFRGSKKNTPYAAQCAAEDCGKEANISKLLAAEASWEAAEAAMQTFGGFSFAEEYNIERKFRETRLYQIAPVSTNMILAYVAHKVLGFPRSY